MNNPNFLNYQESLKTYKDGKLVYKFYEKEDSFDYDYDPDDDNHVLFAVIDTSKEVKKHEWLITANIPSLGAKKEFRGFDSDDDARNFVEEKWRELKKRIYPKGLHFLGEFPRLDVYYGNMKIAFLNVLKTPEKTMFFGLNTTVCGYDKDYNHANKFFFEQQYLHDDLPLKIAFRDMLLVRTADLQGSEKENGEEENAKTYSAIKNLIKDAFDFDRYEKNKAAVLEKATKTAAAKSQFLGFKRLKGTPKQCKWAEQIRSDFLTTCSESAAKKAKRPTTAKYWIDNRNNLSEKLGK